MVEDLAELDNVVGLKDNSGNLPYMIVELLEMVGDKINIVCGHDEVVMQALAAGAKGAILASANVIPDIWVNLYRAIEKGDVKEARKLQRDAQKLARIICRHGGAVAAKAALKFMGLDVGKTRRPLVIGGALSLEVREEIRMELEKLEKVKRPPLEPEITLQSPLRERFQDLDISSGDMEQLKLGVGSGQAGEGMDSLQVDLLKGSKDTLSYAWARALTNPVPGHESLIAILEVNLMAKPATLIVPNVEIRNLKQASIVYDSVEDGLLPNEVFDKLAIIVNVFVHPTASNPIRVTINNYKSTRYALRKALETRPTLAELVERKDSARHVFRYEP